MILSDVVELIKKIKKSEKELQKIVQNIENYNINSNIYVLYEYLLLEDFNIKKKILNIFITKKKSINDFILFLSDSNFYTIRKISLYFIFNYDSLKFNFIKNIIKKLLLDKIIDVNREVIFYLKENNNKFQKNDIFTEKEMFEISMSFFHNKFSTKRILSIYFVSFLKNYNYLLDLILNDKNWRVRFSIIKNFINFNKNQQLLIIQKLKNDEIEEIRFKLAQKITFDNISNSKIITEKNLTENLSFFINDQSINVRSVILEKFINNFDISILDKFFNSDHFLIKKHFLKLKGKYFKKYFDLIFQNIIKLSWKEKLIALEEIDKNLFFNEDFLDLELKGRILFILLENTIFQVRKKSTDILIKLIIKLSTKLNENYKSSNKNVDQKTMFKCLKNKKNEYSIFYLKSYFNFINFIEENIIRLLTKNYFIKSTLIILIKLFDKIFDKKIINMINNAENYKQIIEIEDKNLDSYLKIAYPNDDEICNFSHKTKILSYKNNKK